METKDWVTLVGIMATLVVAGVNLFYNVTAAKRTTFVNAVTTSRIKWIETVLERVANFTGLDVVVDHAFHNRRIPRHSTCQRVRAVSHGLCSKLIRRLGKWPKAPRDGRPSVRRQHANRSAGTVRNARDPPEAPEGRWQINEMASRAMDYSRIAEMLGDPFRWSGGGLSGWAARAAHPLLQ
jgi:hypothetical protein